MRNKEIDQARVFIYNILSLLFVEEHAKNSANETVQQLKVLVENSFDEEVAKAAQNIVNYLQDQSSEKLYEHYQELFLVPFGKHISLSSSLYHEQREAGTMLVKVRDVLAKTKIRKDENTFKAPEDHYGFIFTLCTYLIEQSLLESTQEDLHKELFVSVINPYIEALIFSLNESDDLVYTNVGEILGTFIQFERAYLDINKAA